MIASIESQLGGHGRIRLAPGGPRLLPDGPPAATQFAAEPVSLIETAADGNGLRRAER